MRRCTYNAIIGRCYQWTFGKEHEEKPRCYYHDKLVRGLMTNADNYEEVEFE